MLARIRLPRTSRSAVPSCTAVTTASSPRPPTITRSPTATVRGLRSLEDVLGPIGRLRVRFDGCRLAGEHALRDVLDGGPRIGAHGAGIAGGDQARRVRNGGGLRLQPRNHIVDLAACLTNLRIDFLVQAAAERVLPLPQRFLALTQTPFGFAQGLALARREPLLVLERPHVAIDLRQVLGQLRLARAQIVARRRDDRGIQTKPRGDLEREAPAGRAVEQVVGRCKGVGVEPERGGVTPSAVEA